MGGTHVDIVHFQAECPFKQSERVASTGEVWGRFLEEAFPLLFFPALLSQKCTEVSPCSCPHPPLVLAWFSLLPGRTFQTLLQCSPGLGCFPWLESPLLTWLAGCPQQQACPGSAVPAEEEGASEGE